MENYRKRLHNAIPGGAHTYSRGDDQFPENAPSILERGKGAYIWAPDGKKYLDYGMGLRSVTIGYAYESIMEAAYDAIKKGNNLTRPSTVELEAAELIKKLIPSADLVKFAKNGSNVTTAAVKLARAYTKRKYVALCDIGSFFSFDDWYIGLTPMDDGIPEEHKQLSLKFSYNDIDSVKKLFDEYPNQIAAVILEPVTFEEPKDNFLQDLRKLCTEQGAVLIFDEMISGFRWHIGGAQAYYNVKPDLTTFGKAMANGFSVAALCGKQEIMELGGLNHNKERVFLISTTHGAEMSGLAAFIATTKVLQEKKVIEHMWDYGKKLQTGMNKLAKEKGIDSYFEVVGCPPSPNYIARDENGNASFEFRTLYSQEMVNNEVLMPWIALSYSHQEKELELTFDAVSKSFDIYRKAIDEGIKNYLKSKPVKPVFRKFN